MVERTRFFDIFTQIVLIVGLIFIIAPVYMVFVAASHDFKTVNMVPMPLVPSGHFFENLKTAWKEMGFERVIWTSLIVATGVAIGKIILSSITAFSIVYFNYRLRMLVFWAIFLTLMLPLEVRIVPTYAVAANALSPIQGIFDFVASYIPQVSIKLPEWNLLNSYEGLILPLIATATGTFLYRQFFLTIPEELTEAAKMDGAGALRFFIDVLLPLSKTNMAALGIIMFVKAWNEYLWPILVVTDQRNFATATIQLGKVVPGLNFGEPPVWNTAMAATLITMTPPLIVVILLQRWFVKGLVSTEK